MLNSIGTEAEKASLDVLGYSAPYPLSDAARAQIVLEQNIQNAEYSKNPHTVQPEVRHLLSDPALVEQVNTLCSSNLKLWRSAFFAKRTGSGEIGWHHDKHFYSDQAKDIRLNEIGSHFSVLVALTDMVNSTGQVEVLPGTHHTNDELRRDTRPFHKRPSTEHILRDLPESVIKTRRPVPIPANCFVVFHSALLHRSLPHLGGVSRLGLAIRLVRDDLEIPSALAEPQDILDFPPAA